MSFIGCHLSLYLVKKVSLPCAKTNGDPKTFPFVCPTSVLHPQLFGKFVEMLGQKRGFIFHLTDGSFFGGRGGFD